MGLSMTRKTTNSAPVLTKYLLLEEKAFNDVFFMVKAMGHQVKFRNLIGMDAIEFQSWSVTPSGPWAHIVISDGVDILLHTSGILGQFDVVSEPDGQQTVA